MKNIYNALFILLRNLTERAGSAGNIRTHFAGKKDVLSGYELNMLEITDPEVLRKSGQKYHPVLEFSGNADDEIEGVLFEVTEAEILQADEYEVDDYQRIETVFKSGNKGFIYVGK